MNRLLTASRFFHRLWRTKQAMLIATCLATACVGVDSSNPQSGSQNLNGDRSRTAAGLSETPVLPAVNVDQNAANRNSDNVKFPKADMKYCQNLHRVRLISTYQNETDDPAFFEFVRYGDKATPCLIERITDTAPMKDPLSAPGPRDFRTGDAAVFMLLVINNVNWVPDEMLPPENAAKWQEIGIFAYFEAVSDAKNRVIVQNWWRRRWLNKQSSAQSSAPQKQSR